MPEATFTIVEAGDQEAAEPVVLVRAVQTCIVCPSQWDAWDAEGRYFYLRHRHGRGSVDHFTDPDPDTWASTAGDGPLGQVARFHQELVYGGDGDDMGELRSFCELAGIQLAPDFQLTTFEGHIARQVAHG